MSGDLMARLLRRAQERLGCEVSGYVGERGLMLDLPRECYVVDPETQRLERWEPPPPAPRELRWGLLTPPLALDQPIPDRSAMRTVTLTATEMACEVAATIREPVPLCYDTRGKWKRHPPSKRRRMKSWLRALPEEKRRYAPLRGWLGELPRWARHPELGSTRRVGEVYVRRSVLVYADEKADAWKPEAKSMMNRWALATSRRLGMP